MSMFVVKSIVIQIICQFMDYQYSPTKYSDHNLPLYLTFLTKLANTYCSKNHIKNDLILNNIILRWTQLWNKTLLA